MRKQRSALAKKQQIILGIITIVATLIASMTALLIVATKPYIDAEKQVIAIAESKADIRTVSEFDIYHGLETFLVKRVKVKSLPSLSVKIQVWLIFTSSLMVLVSR